MKKALDKFSKQSAVYKKFRPTYPAELFSYIYTLCPNKNIAWDCGTGNGQVALILAGKFNRVYATDISEKQIQNAERKANIIYSVSRAEKTAFPENSIDLITVAQAIHWFDIQVFNKEAKRVLKPGGIIAIWGYGLLRTATKLNNIIDNFYSEVIGEYWNKERKHIDNNYESVVFDFNEIENPHKFQIRTTWTLEQLKGYFNSWSGVQNYIRKNNGRNPVDTLIEEIADEWNPDAEEFIFPIFLRVGKK